MARQARLRPSTHPAPHFSVQPQALHPPPSDADHSLLAQGLPFRTPSSSNDHFSLEVFAQAFSVPREPHLSPGRKEKKWQGQHPQSWGLTKGNGFEAASVQEGCFVLFCLFCFV